MDDEAAAIVIDNGADRTKAGFAGDDFPRAVFPTVVGRAAHGPQGSFAMGSFVGDGAQSARDALTLTCPIQRGVVTNWDDMEKIWLHIFHDALRASPEEHALLLTEPLLNPPRNREKIAEVVFERFNAPALLVAPSAELAIHLPAGRTCGVVLESGHDVTLAVPVSEGRALAHAAARVDFGGRGLTERLARRLAEGGCSVDTLTARDVKEKLGRVSHDFDEEARTIARSTPLERQHELPDGRIIDLGDEGIRTPETLFQPALASLDAPGIHEMIHQSIGKCDADLRSHFYRNIVLAGGTTLFPGFVERLQKELTSLAPPSTKVTTTLHSDASLAKTDAVAFAEQIKIVAEPYRQHSVWISGSILGSLSTFNSQCCSKQQYEEVGPSIVHRQSA